jgi:hypothetical protein
VGDEERVLRWDGTTLHVDDTGLTADLDLVWGSSAQDVWAFGDDGEVRRFDGSAWTELDPPELSDLRPAAVTGFGPDSVFLLAWDYDDDYLVHWDGNAWTVLELEAVLGEPLPVSYSVGTIAGTSPEDLVVAGSDGLVFQTTCP